MIKTSAGIYLIPIHSFALSKDPIFLKKVDELAEKLEPVFGTKSGLPAFGVNTGE
jgi:mannosyl-oligosaccharide alpha-1,2-mannosidase